MSVKKRFKTHLFFVLVMHNAFACYFLSYFLGWLEHNYDLSAVAYYAMAMVAIPFLFTPWLGPIVAALFVFKFLPETTLLHYLVAMAPVLLAVVMGIVFPEKMKFKSKPDQQ